MTTADPPPVAYWAARDEGDVVRVLVEACDEGRLWFRRLSAVAHGVDCFSDQFCCADRSDFFPTREAAERSLAESCTRPSRARPTAVSHRDSMGFSEETP
jgi:hypothetical protein